MKKAYINCNLLDGSKDMTPLENITVIIDDDKITYVGDSPDSLKDIEIEDLKGRYVMPGLINLHLHLPATGKPKKKESDPAKLSKLLMSNPLTRLAARAFCEKNAKTQLLSGVTTIRAVGGVGSIDTQIRDRINSRKTLGPRLLAANMAVATPGGHMAGSLAYEATSPEGAVALVKRICEDKPDLIKLMITGGVLDAKVKGEPGILKMPAEYVKACCVAAHKEGIKVAAHVESSEGVKIALENGVDCIEHGAPLDDEAIKLFKNHKANLVCTISPALPYALFDRELSGVTEDVQYNGKVVMDGIIECAKQALKNNIPVGLGTDTGCPYITHYDTWRELNYFSKYLEVSNAFALYTATNVNAQILGIDNLGMIKAGYLADILVTDANPLDSLTALRQPYMVVAGGKEIKEPKVSKLLNVEAILDKWL